MSAISYAQCLGLHFGFNTRRTCGALPGVATARERCGNAERFFSSSAARPAAVAASIGSSGLLLRYHLATTSGREAALASRRKLKSDFGRSDPAGRQDVFGRRPVAANDVIESAGCRRRNNIFNKQILLKNHHALLRSAARGTQTVSSLTQLDADAVASPTRRRPRRERSAATARRSPGGAAPPRTPPPPRGAPPQPQPAPRRSKMPPRGGGGRRRLCRRAGTPAERGRGVPAARRAPLQHRGRLALDGRALHGHRGRAGVRGRVRDGEAVEQLLRWPLHRRPSSGRRAVVDEQLVCTSTASYTAAELGHVGGPGRWAGTAFTAHPSATAPLPRDLRGFPRDGSTASRRDAAGAPRRPRPRTVRQGRHRDEAAAVSKRAARLGRHARRAAGAPRRVAPGHAAARGPDGPPPGRDVRGAGCSSSKVRGAATRADLRRRRALARRANATARAATGARRVGRRRLRAGPRAAAPRATGDDAARARRAARTTPALGRGRMPRARACAAAQGEVAHVAAALLFARGARQPRVAGEPLPPQQLEPPRRTRRPAPRRRRPSPRRRRPGRDTPPHPRGAPPSPIYDRSRRRRRPRPNRRRARPRPRRRRRRRPRDLGRGRLGRPPAGPAGFGQPLRRGRRGRKRGRRGRRAPPIGARADAPRATARSAVAGATRCSSPAAGEAAALPRVIGARDRDRARADRGVESARGRRRRGSSPSFVRHPVVLLAGTGTTPIGDADRRGSGGAPRPSRRRRPPRRDARGSCRRTWRACSASTTPRTAAH